MSVNNKRVFYVKYLAHPVYAEIMQARPDIRFDRLENESPDEIAAPIVAGAHRISRNAPDYADARPFHEALTAANPERLVWGSDWPHPRVDGEMPDVGRLFELFCEWTPDDVIRRRILVDNPARLYHFPN